MNAASSPDLAETYVDVLEGFGLSRPDLDDRQESEGPLTPETVRWDLELDDPDGAYACLQQALGRSRRGIEAPRRYWSQAPAFQLSDVLAPYGYEVSFEAPGGGEFGAVEDRFDVVLTDGETTERTTFVYPEGPYGDDNYPALVHAVERRLLPEEDLRFVLLEGHEDAWRFVLVDREALAALREEYGPRIEVFGRPLLDEDQPADYVTEAGGTDPGERGAAPNGGLVGGFDSVVAASGIDDVFESIEREVATEPVVPGPEAGADVGEEVDEIITSVGGGTGVVAPSVRDVSDDRLDEVVERFEADPTEIEDASATLSAVGEGGTDGAAVEDAGTADPTLREEHIPSPAPREDRPAGLSSQVAEALYSGEEDASAGTDARTNGGTPDGGPDRSRENRDVGFVPAVGEGSWDATGDDTGRRSETPSTDGAGEGATVQGGRERRAGLEEPVDPRAIGDVDPDDEGDGDPGRIRRLTERVRKLL